MRFILDNVSHSFCCLSGSQVSFLFGSNTVSLFFIVHTQASIRSVQHTSVLHLSSLAFTSNSRDKAISLMTPANETPGDRVSAGGQLTVQMTPDPGAFKCAKRSVKEEDQMLAVTSASLISSIMDSDISEDEDCYSSASSSCSSLPSPEIFRRENDGMCFLLMFTTK